MSGEYFTPQHVAGTRAGAEGWQGMTTPNDVLNREQFLNLVGSVRANGSFPDTPFLAFYDEITQRLTDADAALAEVRRERDELEGKLVRLQEFVNRSAYGRDLAETQQQLALKDRRLAALVEVLKDARELALAIVKIDSLSIVTNLGTFVEQAQRLIAHLKESP